MKTAEEFRTIGDEESESAEPVDTGVTAHRCSPERTVFTEKDNTDGWIATDLTVELRR